MSFCLGDVQAHFACIYVAGGAMVWISSSEGGL